MTARRIVTLLVLVCGVVPAAAGPEERDAFMDSEEAVLGGLRLVRWEQNESWAYESFRLGVAGRAHREERLPAAPSGARAFDIYTVTGDRTLWLIKYKEDIPRPGSVYLTVVNETAGVPLVTKDMTYGFPDNGHELLAVSGDCTLVVRFYTFVGSDSEQEYSPWRFFLHSDGSPPAITTSLSTTGWTRDPITVTATATDDGCGVDLQTFEWSSDGVAWNEGDAATASASGRLYFRVGDNLGTVGTQYVDVTNIDKTAPTVSISGNPTTWTQGPVILTATGSDAGGSGVNAATYQWSLDNANWTNGQSKAISQNGTVYFRVQDNVGNWSNGTSATVTKIDTTLPVLSTQLQPTTWTQGDIMVSATATDNASGVDSTTWQYKVDTANWTDGSSVTVSQSCTVYFQVEDVAGNLGSTSVAVDKIDRTPPTISTSQSPTGWTSGSVVVTASATDGGSGVDDSTWKKSLDGAGWPTGNTQTVTQNQTVFFKVEDNAGNEGSGSRAVTNIDKTAPTVVPQILTAGVQADTWSSATSVQVSATVSDSGSGVSTRKYKLGSGSWITWTGTPISVTAEGATTVGFQAADTVGNTATQSIAVKLDRTAPTLTSLKTFAGSVQFENGAVCPSANVTVQPEATDLAGAVPGQVDGFEYLVSDTPPDGTEDWTWFDGPEVTVSALAQGTHYLWVRAVDAAGNSGAHEERVFSVDISTPLAPQVTSPTHPKATSSQEATPTPDAVFKVEPSLSQTGSAATMSKYDYTLWKGSQETLTSSVDAGMDTTIELLDLENNGAEEFYTLHVSGVGVNGNESATATYQFRVDTEPPALLTVSSSTHANPDLWYADSTAVLTWNRPVDMTGISTYYVWTGVAEPDLPATQEELRDADLSAWTTTQQEYLEADLADIVHQATGTEPVVYGTVHVAVCAEDYAGNRQVDVFALHFDTDAPWIDGAQPIAASADIEQRSATVTWGTPTDPNPDAGSASAYIRIAEIGADGTVGQPFVMRERILGAGTEVFEGLDAEATGYRLTVTLKDGAGNTKEYAVEVPMAVAVLPPLSIPFDVVRQGFHLMGVMEPGGTVRDASLSFPAALRLHVWSEAEATWVGAESVAISAVSFIDGEPVYAETDPEASYRLEVAGFPGVYQGLGFDASTGLLGAANLAYEAPALDAIGNETTQSVTYESVWIAPPPVNGFEACGTALGTLSVPLKDGEGNRIWDLLGTASSVFEDYTWRLSGGGLDTTGLRDECGTNVYVQGVEAVWSLPVPEAPIGPDGVARDAPIAGDFFLESGGARLHVKQAMLRGDRIVVLDADLSTVLGGTEQAVSVANLSLGWDGKLREEPGFWAGTIAWTEPTGTTFAISDVEIVDGAFWLDGMLTTASGIQLGFTQLGLSQAGPSYGNGAVIDTFSATVHGFGITSTSALLRDDRVVLAQASISLPTVCDVSTRPIVGIELKLSDLSVLVPGYGTAAFGFDTIYGGLTTVSSLELDATGLFAAGTVPLPADVGGGVLPFARLEIGSNNSLVQSEPDTAQRVWTIDGHSVGVTGTTYDGAKVEVGEARATVMPGAISADLVFSGMGVTSAGIADPGVSEQTLNVTVAGFSLGLSGLKLDASGVWAAGEADLDPAFEVQCLVFPDVELLPQAGFDSGYAEEDSYFAVSGWAGVAYNARLDSTGLSVERFDVEVLYDMGDAVFQFPNVLVDSNAQPLACGVDSTPRLLVARQGYAARLVAARLGTGGIAGDATVTLPEALGASEVAFPASTLGPNGRLYTQPSGAFVYQVGEWAVEGSGAELGGHAGLKVAQNRVLVAGSGLSITIGPMAFRSDGKPFASAQVEAGLDLPLFGGGVHVERFTFGDEGLLMQAWIVLPAAFGGDSIFFDGLKLHADGVMTTTVPVSEATIVVGGAAGLTFVFRDVMFDRSGLYIGEAVLRLPEALENRSLRVTNLRIDSAGEFSFSSLSTDPIQLFGFTLFVDGIGFQDNVLSFAGSIMFPESMPGQLSSRVVRIDEFRFNLATYAIEAFSVTWEGELVVPFGQQCRLIITDLGVEAKQGQPGFLIAAEEAKLDLPPAVPVGAVAIQGVKFNPIDASFVFDNVTLEQVSLEKFGLDFVLTEIAIDSSFDMTFTGVGTLPATLPAPLAGATLTVDTFQVLHTGAIGAVQGSLSGLDGTLFETLVLEDGLVSIDKGDDHFLVGVAGHIMFGPLFPTYLQDKGVVLREFVLDPVAGEVVAFDAYTDPLYLPLMGGAAVEDAVLGACMDPQTKVMEVSVAGDIVLPPGLPPALREGRIEIAAFRFGLDGTLKELDATLSLPGDRDLFGGVLLREAAIGIQADSGLLVFQVTGTLALGASFPQGLAGLSCTIADLTFDSSGNIQSIAATVNVPEQMLFGTLTLRGGSVSFAKVGSSNLTVSVAGDFVLPSTFPQGLAGLVISIDEFTIDSTGAVLALSAGASDIDVSVFGILDLEDGAISVSGASNTGVTFQASGDLVLPTTLPSPLGGARLGVETLVLSTTSGLVDFKAGLTQELSFPLFAGITASFLSLDVGEDGFALSGNIKFPSTFPNGLAGLTVSLETLEMTWGGQITAISAGLEYASITLGGFTATVKDLMFCADSVTLGSCTLALPAVVGGQSVELRNARFDKNGTFTGEVVLESLTVEVAGFKLVLSGLGFDIPNKRLTVAAANLQGPAFLGGFTIQVNGVSVGPDGLAFSGGQFRIPDFTVAGGLGFRDMMVNFSLQQGQYLIEGGGQAMIPGAGTFSAFVSFTNVSSTYPIGLKRAEFSYTVYGLGLPLGPTGLYLNQIEGGIAYGPPDEVPSRVRGMFASGTRLKLGLGVQDATFGTVFRGHAAVWVDVTNWAFAFQGDMTILNGVVNAQVIAALSNRIFYGYVGVQLTFVRGEVEFYIFDYGGPRFSGAGSLQIGVPRGAVVNQKILWWWVVIPGNDWWSPKIGAEFGMFTDGSTGFKGYVDVPLFGQVGIFVARGQAPRIGGVSQYVLYRPFSASVVGPGAARVVQGPRYESRSYRQGSPGTDVQLFRVPGRGTGGPAAGPDGPRASVRRSEDAALDAGLVSEEAEPERLVFAVAFDEGDPVATAVSPSGRRYSTLDPSIEVLRTEWGMAFVVTSPEAGEWSLEVSNVASQNSYGAMVFGKIPAPEIVVTTPAYEGEIIGEAVVVRGRTQSAEGGVVTAYASRERDTYVGRTVAEGAIGADGSFELTIPGAQIAADERYVFVGARVGDAPEQRGYAPGSLRRAGAQPLAAIEGLLASDAGDGELDLRFDDPNGQTAAGFVVYVERPGLGTLERLEIGYLTEVKVPGFLAGEVVRVSVAAYDSEGAEGPRTADVEVVFASPPPDANQVAGLTADPLQVTVEQTVPASLGVSLENAEQRDDAYGYVTASVVTLPEGLGVSFPVNPLKVVGEAVDLPVLVFAREGTAPGEYTAVIEVANLGARDSSAQANLAVSVSYPPVVLDGLAPDSWNTRDAVELSVEGSGFYLGSRVFLDQEELEVGERWPERMTALVPAGLSAGQHTLRVQGPGGDSAELGVTVVAPEYSVIGLLDHVQVTAGRSARLYLGVQGHNGWDEKALLQATDVPSGWWATVTPSAIGVGEEATVEVTVPESAEPGEYEMQVTADNGVVAALEVEVTAAPEPRIEYVSRTVALPGDDVVIYGSGFGVEGEVRLGEGVLEASQWAPERIVAAIDEDSLSGDLVVRREALDSNAVAVTVLQTGLSMYGPRKALDLQPGQQRVVEIAISGRAREVTLELDAGEVPASLSRTSVVPNAVVDLTLAAPAATGRYTVLVRGRAGNLSRELGVEVVVGNALSVDTESLPEAVEDVPYVARVQASNGMGDLRFEVVDGKLPVGIGMGSAGELRGTPTQPGTSSFRVRVTDSEGHAASRELAMVVSPNAWAQTRMDGTQASYNPVPSPADARLRWGSAPEAGAHSVLVAAERVLVVGSESVAALDRDTGRVVWRLEGAWVQAFVAQEQLWLLDAAGALSVHDARYGGQLWAREGVRAVSTDGARAALIREQAIDLVEVASGNLTAAWPLWLEPGGLLWREGRLYQSLGSELREIAGGEVLVRYADPVAEIASAGADEQGFVLALSDGRVVSLDAEGSVVAVYEGESVAREVALAGPSVLVLTTSGLERLDRAGLGVVHRTTLAGSMLVAAARKDFVAGTQELVAVNRTAGSVIWRQAGGFVDLALAGSKLYALAEDGCVLSFNAPDNVASPVTVAATDPVAPDGQNGWYASTPTVSLVATDAETEAALTSYKLGDGEPAAYAAPFALADGTAHLVYWSVDTDGLREPDRIAVYQVDTVAPTATGSLQGEMGPGGTEPGAWYWSVVGVTLSGADTTSGVDRLEYAVDGCAWARYVATVVVDTEGAHGVSYRAVDRAGHVSEVGTLSFRVDLAVPVVEAHATESPGLGVVYLEAHDTGSGVQAIEYRVDAGEVQVYLTPVLIAEAGTHQVSYRVRDVAGRESAWQELWLTVEPYAEHGLIRDLDYWRNHVPGRAVVQDVQVGERLYGGVQHPENRIDALPAGVAGSWYLRLGEQDKRCDESVLVDFRAGADLVVTLLVHPSSRADMRGWTTVQEGFPVEGEYFFRGGAKVYTRNFEKWERVRVPGPRLDRGGRSREVEGWPPSNGAQARGAAGEGWPPLVFVKADTRGQVRVVEPEPGVVLRPEQEVRPVATNLDAESGVTATWRVRYDRGQWTAIVGQTLTLPYTDGVLEAGLEATLYSAAGEELGRAREDYRVENGAGIRLVDPAPGSVLVAGSVVTALVEATDMNGAAVSADVVSWRQRVEGDDWEPTEATLHVPAGFGGYEIEATWPLGGEHARSRVWKLRIGAEPQPLEVLFGRSSAEVEDEKPSGTIYGFSTDHGDRVGAYWSLAPGEWRWKPGSFVELEQGESFRMHVGVGRMRVELTVGAFRSWPHASGSMSLEGRTIALPADHQKRLVNVVTEVTVTDGVLEIRGTEDLPLVCISVQELPPDAPPVPDAVSKRSEWIWVAHDPPDDGWNRRGRWDSWDDGNQGRGGW